jgi:hypothetical protein
MQPYHGAFGRGKIVQALTEDAGTSGVSLPISGNLSFPPDALAGGTVGLGDLRRERLSVPRRLPHRNVRRRRCHNFPRRAAGRGFARPLEEDRSAIAPSDTPGPAQRQERTVSVRGRASSSRGVKQFADRTAQALHLRHVPYRDIGVSNKEEVAFKRKAEELLDRFAVL